MIDASGCLIIEPFSGASTGWLYHDGFGWLENRNKIISVVVRNGVNVVLTPELHGASVNGMFHGCANLVKADLSGLNTSEVVDASYMFSDCLSLTDLNLSGWDTSKVTDMTGMFSGCASLKALDVAGLNTSKVTEMGDMFSGCESLESLNLKSFDVSGVMNMRNMFSDCSGLTVLNVSGWSTSKVTDMSEMFSGCSSLVDLSLSGWDTSSVENMSNMFYYCTSLESLDLKHFDVKSVKNMSNMFCGCSNLISLDLLGWITSNVTSMDGMFDGCSSLGDLNLSSFDTSRVASTQSMFSNCSNLISITLGAAFSIEGYGSNGRIVFPVPSGNGLTGRWLSSDDGIAYTADGIPSKIAATYTAQEDGSDSWNQSGTCIWRIGKEGDLVIKPLSGQRGELSDSFSWNNSSSLLKSVSFEGEVVAPSSLNGMFSDRTSLTAVDFTGFDTSNVTSMFCMFSGCSSLESLNLTGFDTSDVTDMSNMFQGCSSLETLDLSIFNTSKVTDMLCMFSGCSSLSSLNLSGWNTASAVNMSNMFGYCSSLESLDLPGWNTSSVANMSGIFQGCSSLESINLSDFDTSKVVDMSDMFRDCASVDTLDLSAFNTSKVTDMSYMFSGCSSLETLDLSGWTNPMVADMSWMFNRCSALTALDLSNFGTSRVTNMSGMFGSCSSLVSLNLKSFDTANVENMSYMFYCSTSIDKIPPSKLRAIDLSSFSTSRVKSMFYMFWGCSSLESLDVSGFDTSRVTDTGWMFGDCSSLKSIDLSGWNTSKVVSMSSMFSDCSSLESLDVSSFNTSKVTSMHGMFEGCSSLESLDLSSFDTLKVTDMASMLESCSGMRSVALGRNFAFIPPRFSYERVGLPTPLGDGFTGLWVSSADGKAYAPDSIPNNVAATYTAQVKGEAAKIAISKSMFTVDANAKTYTGFQVAPEVSSTTLQRGVDYTVSYGTNVNAGPGTVTITGAGSYAGTLSYSFTINKAAPSYVVPSGLSAVYGQTLGDVTLPTGFSWQDDASAKVGDVGRKTFLAVYIPVDTANYETVRNIEVGLDVAPAPLAEGDFSFDLSDAVYAGNPVTGRVSSAVLVEGKDYSVVYADNVNAGAASITVSGVGNYDSGSSITKHFIIEKVDPTYKAPSPISATEGQILGDLKLPDGFSWQDELSTSVGDAGEHIFKAKFTPRDTVNYNVVEDVPVTVVVTESSDGWNPCGDCVWKIDDQGCLVIKPANGVSGTLENWAAKEGDREDLVPPWAPESDSIRSVKVEGKVFATCVMRMFGWCRNLESVDLSGLDTSMASLMGAMFAGCVSLKSLDLSNLDTSHARVMEGMFSGCVALEDLDLSGFNTAFAESMSNMFDSCQSLRNVKLGASFTFSGSGTERLCSLPTPWRDGSTGLWRDSGGQIFAPSEVPDGAGTYTAVFPELADGWKAIGDCAWKVNDRGCLVIKPANGVSGTLENYTTNVENYAGNLMPKTPWEDRSDDIVSARFEKGVTAGSDLGFIFWQLCKLESVDFSNLDMSNVRSMRDAFRCCESLKRIDGLGSKGGVALEDATEMFSLCRSLKAVDLNNIDLSGLDSAGWMFSNCSSLEELDLSCLGAKSSQYRYLSGMLYGCSSLERVDLSGLDTRGVRSMRDMFSGCTSLKYVRLGENFSFSGAGSERLCSLPTPERDGFEGKWRNAAGETFAPSEVPDGAGAYEAVFPEHPDGWTGCGTCMWSIDNDGKLTIKPIDGESGELAEWEMNNNRKAFTPWRDWAAEITSVTVEGKVVAPSHVWGMFEGCGNMASADLGGLDVSRATDMSFMFYGCKSLRSLDLSRFDTKNATDMGWMFSGCSALESLDVSGFDTSSVTEMGLMFDGCSSLQSLDVSGFDTTKAANVAGMFQRCPELRSLDVSGFDTSSVTDMDCMFSGCSKLEELDLSNFDTSSVTSMWAVFKECDSLRSLDLSSFETSNVKTMRWLFFDCNNLESVNVSSFDTSQVTDMVQMFIGCTSLQSLDLSSFDTSNVATMDWMFAVCPSLESVTLGKNFSFCGAGSERQCSLPEQNAGNWVDVATGKAYRADAIPNNVAATYRVQRSLLESDFTVDVSDAVYSGEPVTGRVSSDSLEEGVDYDVTYSGNVNAGEAAVSIAGKGLYTGSLSYAFRIIPAGITADMVSGIPAQMEATGSQLRPEPAVAFNGKALAEGEDYTLSYGENVEPGEGSVTVSAIEGGNFTGSAIVYFDIEKKAEPVNPDPGTGGGGTDPAPIPDPGTGGGSGGGGGAPAPAPEPRQFAVTYHLDGGANAASNPATFAAGTAVALAAPTRDGYEFLGWYADAALTKRVTGIPADASGDVELWAKWALKAAPAPTFPDVDYSESSWYGKAVTYVAEKGLITGYTDGDKAGLFGVGDTLTRAQLATILWRNACPDEAASYNSASAKDVTGIAGSADGQYYTAAANWAVKNGVISGYVREDGTHDFAAGDDVSFEQLVTILARLCATDDELAAAGDDLSAFADGGGASGWSRAAFAWAAGKGLVRGYDTPSGKMLSPGEDVARERVAVVLMRAFEMGLLK